MTRVQRWERRAEVPLLLLVVAFLVAYAWPVVDPRLDGDLRFVPEAASRGDALWWSATTVTTVGYGDHFPVTTTGRFVAVALMVVGVTCIGAITAGVAAFLVRQVEADEDVSRPWA